MKLLLVFLTAAFTSLAGHAQTTAPPGQMSELRMAILQSKAAAAVTGMRQLTAEQRAELRRQVLEQSRRPSR